MVKLRDDDSPTSHLQQRHRPRSPSLEPQRWFASEFAKPRIYRKPREVSPKIVQEYLYDKVSTEVHVLFSGMANTIRMIPELLNKY